MLSHAAAVPAPRASSPLCCTMARSARCLRRATPRAASRCSMPWMRTVRSACPMTSRRCPAPMRAMCRCVRGGILESGSGGGAWVQGWRASTAGCCGYGDGCFRYACCCSKPFVVCRCWHRHQIPPRTAAVVRAAARPLHLWPLAQGPAVCADAAAAVDTRDVSAGWGTMGGCLARCCRQRVT